MQKLISLILIGVFLLTGALGLLFFKFINVPAGGSEQVTIFEVPPGTSYYKVVEKLSNKRLISERKFFYWYGRLMNYAGRIQVGEYELNPTLSPREILEILASGKSITYSITVPEGFNIFEIAAVLDQLWQGRGEEFLKLVRDPVIVKRYLGENRDSMEGYLFPDTYIITKYTPTSEIIEMMYNRFDEEFQAAVGSRRSQFSKHEIVTLASVIEKETGAPEERPLISSVFHNRLEKGMRLQSDPTIIYGMWAKTGKAVKNIRRRDIKAATPYNTYTVKALPKGPIANPGREALKATIDPDSSDYFYFVSKNDGTHIFTKKYEDHLKAVKKFQLDRAARKGKSWRDLSKRKSAKND